MDCKILIGWIIALASVCGMLFCGCKRDSASERLRPSLNQVASDDTLVLPMPEIPENITVPAKRAAYAAVKWWDHVDFKDHKRSLDTAFMEQNFSNFVMVLANADTVAIQKAVDTLMDKAERDPEAWQFLLEVVDKYLYDPNSPFHSDELYIPFLRHVTKSPLVNEGRRERALYRLEMALKNRPGTMAADFRFLTREGTTMTLHEVKSSRPILLIFYNPDCESCEKVVDRLRRQNLTDIFTVLAIDAESDIGRWKATAGDMPYDWTVGHALTPVLENDLYDLKASPTIYLLDADKKVAAKDISPDQISS